MKSIYPRTATSRSKTWVWTVLHTSLTTEDHSCQARKSEFDTTEHLVCSHRRLMRIWCLRDLCTPLSTRDLASLTLRGSRIRFIVTTNPEIDSLPCRSLGQHCANLKETPDKRSCQLSVLHPPGLDKLSQLQTRSKQLYGTCWSCQLATLPLQVRREYRKKKNHNKIIGKYFSFSWECCWYDHLFIFCESMCTRMHAFPPPHLSSLWCEQSRRLACPFPARQTISNKIHLLQLKAVLSSYPWRSDVCSPFYHLSCTCFDCKHPDNTPVSPSQVK